MAATDAACWPLAFGFVLLIEGWPTTSGGVIAFAAIGAAAQLGCGFVTGLYRRRFLPFSFEEIGVTACTIGLAGWIVLLIDLASDKPRVGHAGVWATATAAAMILGLRYARRYRARWIRSRTTRSRLPVVVVGAGDGATRAIRAMISSPISPYRPVAP